MDIIRLQNIAYIQFGFFLIGFIDDLLTESLEIKNQVKANNGTVSLPTGPGLGVTPKRDFLDSFRIFD